MNERIKKLWVEALRSGEYKQARGALNRPPEGIAQPGYCCLGVLCDLFRKDTGRGRWIRPNKLHEHVMDFETVDEDGDATTECSHLPREVVEWAGLTDNDPILDEGIESELELEDAEYPGRCSAMNDDGVEFPQIASLIERVL